MSRINTLETEKIKPLCLDAVVVDARRCQPILCASDNPEAGIAPQVHSPDLIMLKKGDVCVATTFYSTGHSSPDCSCDQDNIYRCLYRRTE